MSTSISNGAITITPPVFDKAMIMAIQMTKLAHVISIPIISLRRSTLSAVIPARKPNTDGIADAAPINPTILWGPIEAAYHSNPIEAKAPPIVDNNCPVQRRR